MTRRLRSLALGLLIAVVGLPAYAGASDAERALTGTAYELKQPWCFMTFSDKSTGVIAGKCLALNRGAGIVSTGPVSNDILPAGTCLKLGEPHVSYRYVNRELSYDVTVAGRTSTIPASYLAEAQELGHLNRAACEPGTAPTLQK